MPRILKRYAGFSRRMLPILGAVFLAGSVHADTDRYEVTFAKNLTFRGGKITVDHRFGSLVVRTEAGSKVAVRAKIRASSPEYGQRIRILTNETGDGVTVKTVYPEGRSARDGDNSYSVDYDITVPDRAPVVLRNRFGNIRLSDHRAAATIVNSHGQVVVDNGQGARSVENAFGSIDIRDQAGDVSVRNSNGNVSVKNVGGTVDISNRFANVTVHDIRKPVNVRNTNGNVELRNIGGDIMVVNAYSGITAVDIRGKASITTTNAKVEARNVGGETSIKNSFGTVVAIDIRGALTVSGRHLSVDARNVRGAAAIASEYGNITLADVAGAASVRTSFGSTSVKDVGGAVSVENQNGAIAVSGLNSGRCQPITLRGSYSSIKLRIPSSAGYSLNARTSNGRIVSSLPLTGRAATDETLIGTIGNGTCKLELSNSNGNISISVD